MILQPRFFKSRKGKKGISSLLFDDEDEQKKEEPTSAYEPDPEVVDAQEGYLQSISNQKIKDIKKFFDEDPEEPDFDEDRHKNLQNLSKVNAIASFVDALSQVVPRALTDASDRPTTVTPYNNSLGINSLNMLRDMDTTHMEKMDRFRKELRQTNQYNRNLEFENTRRNQEIDTQEAAAEYESALNSAEVKRAMEAAQQEIKREQKLNDQEAWEEMANRLVSNGNAAAGVEALVNSGRSRDEAQRVIEKLTKKGSSSGIDEPTLNMARRLKELNAQIESSGQGVLHYDRSTGKPISRQATEAEEIKEMLGKQRFDPEVQAVLNESSGSLAGAEAMLSPKNKQRSAGGLDIEAVKKGLNSPESLAKHNEQLVNQVRTAKNEQQQKEAISTWVDALRTQGFSDQEIQQGYRKLLGESSNAGKGASQLKLPSSDTTASSSSQQTLSEEELDDILTKIELEMARGEEGSFSREMTDRLMQLLIGYDSQGRRFQHSAADILKSPFTEGVPRLYQQFMNQQEQAEERRRELLERFINAQNKN